MYLMYYMRSLEKLQGNYIRIWSQLLTFIYFNSLIWYIDVRDRGQRNSIIPLNALLGEIGCQGLNLSASHGHHKWQFYMRSHVNSVVCCSRRSLVDQSRASAKVCLIVLKLFSLVWVQTTWHNRLHKYHLLLATCIMIMKIFFGVSGSLVNPRVKHYVLFE